MLRLKFIQGVDEDIVKQDGMCDTANFGIDTAGVGAVFPWGLSCNRVSIVICSRK